MGTDVANAFVTVWAHGLGTTSGYAGSLGGVDGITRPVTIPAGCCGSATAVNVEWTPQAIELGGLAQRRFCVKAPATSALSRRGRSAPALSPSAPTAA